jgi:predicted ATP-dependent endonuclease of OLD family
MWGRPMHITDVVIENYRCLKSSEIHLNDRLNIIVGDNECGKSTFLEAVYLALSGQINGRPIQSELHTHLFNSQVVSEYISALIKKETSPPPKILIELYFADDPALVKLKGTNNTKKADVPGVKLSIEFNDDFRSEYTSYISDPKLIKTVPVEYYVVRWRNFADNDITSRSIPIKPCMIDASAIRNTASANRYILDVVKDSLSKKQQVDLALSYRLMKDKFLSDDKVKEINVSLAAKKGHVSDKSLSVSLDTSSRASWEAGIMPHLNEIPMPLVGKGEQNSVKIRLAMESSAEAHLFLIEEPENHLSYSNLNILINRIAESRGDRQLLITTHSSFVLNKLGVDSVLLFSNGIGTTLEGLTPETLDYFVKLPGHDTLRLILSKRAILVEGPSDELIVQKAFFTQHEKMPLELGVDVISVRSLAFKRFLEIASILGTQVDVVTDNDGDVGKVQEKYATFSGKANIRINYDDDENFPTLEPQLLKSNGRDILNNILGKSFSTDEELLKYMSSSSNKTECALKLFETASTWTVPEYIKRAVA